VNRVDSSSGPLDRLAAVAGVVFVVDFASKQWALRHFDAIDPSLTTGWHLAVINNTHLGWGLGTSNSALPLTLILTVAIAALVLRICHQLAAVDPDAPTMLGLLVGSGAANLADALIPPHGVVDFIAFTRSDGVTTSFNVADIMLAIGLVLSIRSMWRIVGAMRGRTLARHRHTSSRMGAWLMRDRLIVSGGHALLAMCAFIWLYSMALAWTVDAGRSAPNSLLCGVGVFAVAFLVSQARMRVLERRAPASAGVLAARRVERVVLDGSVPVFGSEGEVATPRPRDVPRTPEREWQDRPRPDEDREGPAA
jgi:lipoprotein signal peptidase